MGLSGERGARFKEVLHNLGIGYNVVTVVDLVINIMTVKTLDLKKFVKYFCRCLSPSFLADGCCLCIALCSWEV